jgi:hypothetical protein
MRKPLHIFALFLFALTQCIAPLVHAHVNGIEANTALHTHDIPRISSASGLACSHFESEESQAISIAHEYQRDMNIAIPSTSCSTTHPLPPRISGLATAPCHAPRSVESSFHKPQTQAPPQSI